MRSRSWPPERPKCAKRGGFFVLSFAAQFTNCFGVIVGTKNRRAGDKDIRAVFDRDLGSFWINAAIHLDVDLVLVRLVPFRCAPDLFHLIGAERLSAKTRMNSHDEQHIELPEERFDHFKW